MSSSLCSPTRPPPMGSASNKRFASDCDLDGMNKSISSSPGSTSSTSSLSHEDDPAPLSSYSFDPLSFDITATQESLNSTQGHVYYHHQHQQRHHQHQIGMPMMQVFTIGQQTNPLPLPAFNLMLNTIQNGAQMAYTGRGSTAPGGDQGGNKAPMSHGSSLCPAGGSSGGGIPILNKPGTCPPAERRDYPTATPPPPSQLSKRMSGGGADDDLEMLVGQVLGERRKVSPKPPTHQTGRQGTVPSYGSGIPPYMQSAPFGGGHPPQRELPPPPSYSEAKKLSVAAEPFMLNVPSMQPYTRSGAIPGSKIANSKKLHQINKQQLQPSLNVKNASFGDSVTAASSDAQSNSSFTVSAGVAATPSTVMPRMAMPMMSMASPHKTLPPPPFEEATSPSTPQPSTAIFVHNIPIVSTDTCGKVCKEKVGRLLKSFGALAYFDICPVGEAEKRFGVPSVEMERIATLRTSFRPTNLEVPDDVRYCVVLAVFDCLKCLEETIRLLNGNFTIFPRMGSIHAERKAAILAGEPVPTREGGGSTEVGVTYESPFKYLICNDVPLYASLAPYEDAREKRNKQKRLVASRFCPFNAPPSHHQPPASIVHQ